MGINKIVYLSEGWDDISSPLSRAWIRSPRRLFFFFLACNIRNIATSLLFVVRCQHYSAENFGDVMNFTSILCCRWTQRNKTHTLLEVWILWVPSISHFITLVNAVTEFMALNWFVQSLLARDAFVRNGNHCSFLTPTLVGAWAMHPSLSNIRRKWPTPSKNDDFDRFPLITSQP